MTSLRRPRPARPHSRPARPVRLAHAVTALLLLSLAAVRTWPPRLETRARARRGDAGYTTETIVVTALLVLLALGVLYLLTQKVLAKVTGIEL